MNWFKQIWKRLNQKPWEEFNRFRTGESCGFYGCVANNGEWFDSALVFKHAVHHAAQYHGQDDLTSEQEIDFMCGTMLNDEVVKIEDRKKAGCSIIHSNMIRKMYEAGLIK
jgi:hypothetical protein|tara:strand:+ start:309 stop:641 length:333 start_codon:yes stop_codon:yes gene_type:complete